MKQYNDYSDSELIRLITEKHVQNKISLRSIAKELGVNVVKVIRFCKKHGISTMSASDSLKSGYSSQRIVNANKGKPLSEERRIRVSESLHKNWESLTEEEREKRRASQREAFSKRDDKESFSLQGSRAIRKAAKEGSKLEKFLITYFESQSIDYVHHYKGMFGSTNLEADFFLPAYGVVIEVDGPSHFTDSFSYDALAKQKMADDKKNGLVLAAGASIIRIQHMRTLYARDYRFVSEQLNIISTLSNEIRFINVQ